MNVKSLKRDPKKVLAALMEMEDGSVVARKEVKIYVPARYAERNLAYVGVENYILGVYGITVDDQFYGVSNVNAMIPIAPTQTNKIKIDSDEYLEFVFAGGATVFKSTNLVRTDTIPYYIYDEFFAKGKLPWFLGYEDLSEIFDTAKKHANANVGQEREVTQLIVSLMARDPQNRTKYYRTVVKSLDDLENRPPTFVPLMSARYAASNTMTRLGGSYFGEGVVASLLNPSERPERIETLLRK